MPFLPFFVNTLRIGIVIGAVKKHNFPCKAVLLKKLLEIRLCSSKLRKNNSFLWRSKPVQCDKGFV